MSLAIVRNECARNERPRGPRVFKRLPVEFGRSRSEVGQQDLTMDVSSRGLSLTGDEVYPAGTAIQLVLRPADAPAFELKGVVIWSSQSTGQMGVKLLSHDARFAKYVDGLLEGRRSGASAREPNPVANWRAPLVVKSPKSHLALVPMTKGERMTRFEKPLAARLSAVEPHDTAGSIVNLSRSGALVRTARTFERGVIVQVTVQRPAGRARMEGEVIWSLLPDFDGEQQYIGLRITRANQAFRQLLEEMPAA